MEKTKTGSVPYVGIEDEAEVATTCRPRCKCGECDYCCQDDCDGYEPFWAHLERLRLEEQFEKDEPIREW